MKFDLNLTDSGREFHRGAPENVRLDLKRSIRGLGILILFCSREVVIGNRRVNEGGALLAIIFFM